MANASAEAPIYLNPDREPFSYSIFLNYHSTQGALSGLGVFLADDMGLGSGYSPGFDEISSYTGLFFRSSLDSQPGLADFHVELWDGDPFCAFDTPGNGFSCAPIPGSEADFIDVPAATQFTARAVLPKGVIAPNQRVWMVVTGSETGMNPSPCRLGWDIAYGPGVIGGNYPIDLFLWQYDGNNGGDGSGTCCDTGAACDAATLCPGDTAGTRGFCYDDIAESIQGVCFDCGSSSICDAHGGVACSNFVASIFSPANATISLIPVSTTAGTIEGKEVRVPDSPTDIELEIRLSNWDEDGDGQKLKGWEVDIDSTGYTGGFQGFLSPTVRDCVGECIAPLGSIGDPCVRDSDCDGLLDPGFCNLDIVSGNEACRAAFSGVCNIFGNPCVVDSDCDLDPFEKCEGSTCGDQIFGSNPGMCTAGFIFTGRDNYVYKTAGGDLPGIDTATLNYRYASAVATSNGILPPDPFPSGGAYLGTLRLTTSADCKGSFSVGFLPPPRSVLVNQNGNFIPLVGFSPAKIVCEAGKCCIDLTGLGGCVDNVTHAQCKSIAGVSSWCSVGTCDDPCIECLTDDQCQDDSWCNGGEVCEIGCAPGCYPGTPPDCDDGLDCTIDSCVDDYPNSGHCEHIPDDAMCDDDIWCNGFETCNPNAGCVPGIPQCNDGVTCTVDVCDEVTLECSFTPNDVACDNGQWCDGIETCDAIAGCLQGLDPCPSSLCDETTDTCAPEGIPTVSGWGTIILALLLVAGWKTLLARPDRQPAE